MRKPKALSPTALRQWRSNRDEFYLARLAERRAPKLPQTRPMGIGSAFDAYEKSALHAALFGNGDPAFAFDTLFVAQVESHNRDWALEHGAHVFNAYQASGAHGELLARLVLCDAVRFEFMTERVVDGVPLSGFPDLHYRFMSVPHVLDWKVKGYCSTASPSPGYVLCRDGWTDAKPSRSHGKSYAGIATIQIAGQSISAGYLESANRDYAEQLSIYAWLEGEAVGDESVVLQIEELTAARAEPRPRIRASNHRARCSRQFQMQLIGTAKAAWSAIESGHIFAELSRADSDARCDVLEQTAAMLAIATDDEAAFNSRKQ